MRYLLSVTYNASSCTKTSTDRDRIGLSEGVGNRGRSANGGRHNLDVSQSLVPVRLRQVPRAVSLAIAGVVLALLEWSLDW